MKDLSDTKIWGFFGLTYGLSWLLWIPAALLDPKTSEAWIVALYLVGGFGPSVAGIVWIGRTQNQEGQRDFLRRLLDFRQIGAGWYAFIFLIFPLLAGLSVLAYRLLQGNLPSLPALDGIAGQPQQLLGLPLLALQVMLFGPLSEEIGWRGFALDRLQKRWNAPVASLILGVLWALWHSPLFFIPGTMYHAWGFGTELFWIFLIRMVCLSLLMTWVYKHTCSSVLSAILLHFTFNFTFMFFHPAPDELHGYGTLLFVGVAICCSMFRSARLTKRER